MPPRGKFSKPTRGGGKKFSRDVRPAEDAPGMWDDGPREKEESEEEESEEEEDSEEEDSDNDTAAKPSGSGSKLPIITADMSRDERKAAQKAIKEAKRAQLAKGVGSLSISDDEDEEEEEVASSSKQPQVQPQKQSRAAPPGNPNAGNTEPTVSRKEREAVEAAAAKERYRKLHEAGKTEEAKSDLARLALIRKEREEKAKQRAAEIDEKKRQADVKAKNSGKKMK